MINDDLSKQKSPHFREKYLVLSYLKNFDFGNSFPNGRHTHILHCTNRQMTEKNKDVTQDELLKIFGILYDITTIESCQTVEATGARTTMAFILHLLLASDLTWATSFLTLCTLPLSMM